MPESIRHAVLNLLVAQDYMQEDEAILRLSLLLLLLLQLKAMSCGLLYER